VEAWGWRPESLFSCRETMIEWLRPSAIITKRKGDKGSPCQIPLKGWKGYEGEPFTRMEKKAPDTIAMIHLMLSLWKPNASKICLI